MTLKVNRSGGCYNCVANSSCGIGILVTVFGRSSVFKKPLQSGVTIGDIVIVEIASKELFYKAFQLYMLPILALFVASWIATQFFPLNESWQIGFGFVGFITTLLLIKYIVK